MLPKLVLHTAKCAGDRTIVLGFDFPIGLPQAYATRAEIENFPDALLAFGSGQWSEFFDIARCAGDITLRRPFYPFRPGGTSQSHLIDALGVTNIRELRRQCEHACFDRGAACPLFWTLGPNQVGRAAIVGWRDMLSPTLRRRNIDVALWPFDGDLLDLVHSRGCVIVETYPADACVQLGLGAPGRGWSKRNQADRRSKGTAILAWAGGKPVILNDRLRTDLVDGFGPSSDGEDPFDAVLGLLLMVDVILGFRRACERHDEPVRRIEG